MQRRIRGGSSYPDTRNYILEGLVFKVTLLGGDRPGSLPGAQNLCTAPLVLA